MSEPGRTAGRRKLTSPVSGLMRMLHLILRSPDRPASGYDAFISYSHLADDALAATLQAGLESFASPWYRSRTLRVFRDTTDLTATPGLLTEITGALSASRWFVLIASEQAAQSRWVNDEVVLVAGQPGPQKTADRALRAGKFAGKAAISTGSTRPRSLLHWPARLLKSPAGSTCARSRQRLPKGGDAASAGRARALLGNGRAVRSATGWRPWPRRPGGGQRHPRR